jgi:hypothetical protein
VNMESMWSPYFHMTFIWRRTAPEEGHRANTNLPPTPRDWSDTHSQNYHMFLSSFLKFVSSFWFHFLLIASHKHRLEEHCRREMESLWQIVSSKSA